MNKRFYCPHCGEHSLVREFMREYYVEFNAETNQIEYADSENEPEIENISSQMYCEICWDFINLDELEDQIEKFKLERQLK